MEVKTVNASLTLWWQDGATTLEETKRNRGEAGEGGEGGDSIHRGSPDMCVVLYYCYVGRFGA